MTEEKLIVTNSNAYKRDNCPTKLIKLPSGSVFKIKLVTIRDSIRLQNRLGISNTVAIKAAAATSDEEKEALANKMTPEEMQSIIKYNDELVMKAVADPKISLDGADNTVSIEDINDTDYYFLLQKITELKKEAGINLQSFRKQHPAVNS